MILKSLLIKNVKSFKEEVKIDFNEKVNILIGPNGGGKSNLLDIIQNVFRKFFIFGYEVAEGRDNRGFYKNLIQKQINQNLEKFNEDNSDSIIKLVIKISEEDIENISIIKNNKESFINYILIFRL